jgi:hypothetical protein
MEEVGGSSPSWPTASRLLVYRRGMATEYFDAGWVRTPKLTEAELTEAESRLLLDPDALPEDWQAHLETGRANARRAMAQELAEAQAVVDSLSD